MPAGTPLALSRSEEFDDLVRSAIGRLERRWAHELDAIEVAVEDVPDPDLLTEQGAPSATSLRLGRSEAAAGDRAARIVVYRRAVESRSRGQRAREALVHEVVVEQLADLLGLDPAAVDPDDD